MDCAIRTDDAMVSRHHSRIFFGGGGGYILEDLQSANGVYFQEQRVQQHLFKHGDAVRCGSLWLRYVDTGQVAGNAPGPAAPAGSPMMQHPGIGAIPSSGPSTGHVGTVQPPAVSAESGMAALGLKSNESEAEIRVLRRRVEQLQTELRVYRAQKFNADTARRMEDLENDLSMMEIERDNLKKRVDKADRDPRARVGQRQGQARARDRRDDGRDRIVAQRSAVEPAHRGHGRRGRIRAVRAGDPARELRAHPPVDEGRRLAL